MMRSALFLLLLVSTLEVFAQAWPSKAIRLVVPLSPGGFADVPARLLAAKLSTSLGKQVFVENQPGAGGTIGANFVAKAAPDGHTILLIATPHVISAHLYNNLPYDSLKAFAPIALIASGPYALVVNSQKLKVSSVRELIAAAKKQPGKIDFASSGNGSAQHLVTALFASMAGIELNHIPYKGSGPAMQDLVGGQVPMSFAGIPNILPHLKSGRLRVLGTTGKKRWAELPDVPTIAEGGVPGYEATLWLSLAAPAGTPPDIIERLHTEIAKDLQDPELLKSFRATGVEGSVLGPKELGEFMKTEYEKWGQVVRQTGATVN